MERVVQDRGIPCLFKMGIGVAKCNGWYQFLMVQGCLWCGYPDSQNVALVQLGPPLMMHDLKLASVLEIFHLSQC